MDAIVYTQYFYHRTAQMPHEIGSFHCQELPAFVVSSRSTAIDTAVGDKNPPSVGSIKAFFSQYKNIFILGCGCLVTGLILLATEFFIAGLVIPICLIVVGATVVAISFGAQVILIESAEGTGWLRQEPAIKRKPRGKRRFRMYLEADVLRKKTTFPPLAAKVGCLVGSDVHKDRHYLSTAT